MAVDSFGNLIHIHYGRKLHDKDYDKTNTKYVDWAAYDENNITLENTQQEYPSYGHTDLRNPAYTVKNVDGNSISQLKYKDYTIKENYIPEIEGMPSLFIGNKSGLSKRNCTTLKVESNILNTLANNNRISSEELSFSISNRIFNSLTSATV